jgi:PITH domain
MSHSHSHDHYDGQGPIDHTHDHDDDLTPAIQNQLYSQIDFPAVRCLNEATAGSAVAVLQKTWTERLDPEPELESDCDEQLLLTVPYCAHLLHDLVTDIK